MITDDDLREIEGAVAHNFLTNAKELYLSTIMHKIDRNRISREGFLKLIVNADKKGTSYPLQILQINDTTIENYYTLIAK